MNGNPLVPLDADPDQLGRALILRQHNREALIEWVRTNLTEKVDFGVIPGTNDKQTLWQPGAQKICGMLGLTAEFPDAEKYVDAAVRGEVIKEVIVRCILRDGEGRAVASGIGAEEVEKVYADYEWYTDDRGQRQKRRVGDRIDRDINRALKMAQKSAHIDATLRAGGLSAIFTQDMQPKQEDDQTPLTEAVAEAEYVLAKVRHLYGDMAEAVLQSLAAKRFRIEGGDWRQIPVFRVSYVVKAIQEKWQQDNPGKPLPTREATDANPL